MSKTTVLESEIGPQVIHLYSVTNIRPATVDKAEITFIWPYKTLGEEDLLTLLEPPEAKYTETKYGTPVINCDNDAVFSAMKYGRITVRSYPIKNKLLKDKTKIIKHI